MAYPFSAELALNISAKYADFCAVTAARMGVPKLLHPPAQPLKVTFFVPLHVINFHACVLNTLEQTDGRQLSQ